MSAIGRNRRQRRDGPWVIPSLPPSHPSLPSPRGRRDVLRRARLYSVRRIMSRLSLCDTLSNFLRSHGAVPRRPTSNRNVRTYHTDVPWKKRRNSARSYAILLQDYCYTRPGCEFSDAVAVAAAKATISSRDTLLPETIFNGIIPRGIGHRRLDHQGGREWCSRSLSQPHESFVEYMRSRCRAMLLLARLDSQLVQ